MLVRTALSGLATFLVATPVLAAPDVRVQISAPAEAHVYQAVPYNIMVANVGTGRASGVTVAVKLPATEVFPHARPIGKVTNLDPRCRTWGTQLLCNVGKLGLNQITTVSFDLALPQADADFVVTAIGSSATPDLSPGNNIATAQPVLLDYEVHLALGDGAMVEWCVADEIVSYAECRLGIPGEKAFEIGFGGDGALEFESGSSRTGWWTQTQDGELATDPAYLAFSIFDGSRTIAEFEGYGSAADCFEGIALLDHGDVAAYEVCL